MKRVLILFLFCISSMQYSPDYSFELAWKGPPFPLQGISIEDLDNDGLSEIMYFHFNEDGEYVFSAFDTFSNPMWEIPSEKYSVLLSLEDVEGDGLKEIFLLARTSSYEDELETHRVRWKLSCLNAEAVSMWSKVMELNIEWDGYLYNRYNLIFADINNDGYKEIMFINLILDKNGNTLYEYDSDYSIIGYIDGHSEENTRIILEKETEPLLAGEEDYAAYCRISSIDGDVLWEKEFSKFTYFSLLEVEKEKRLFFLQDNIVSEVDLSTYKETPRIKFDFDHASKLYYLSIDVIDLDCDRQQEFVLIAMDRNGFGDSAIYVYDNAFHAVWDYSDPHFLPTVVDLDNDGKHEILVDYLSWFYFGAPTFFRVLNYDKSERWTMKFDGYYVTPDILDIDADGDREILFEIDLSRRQWQKQAKEAQEDSEESRHLTLEKYLYILDPDGNLEKQFNVSSGAIIDFHDFDGDGDTDILYVNEDDISLRMYTNTRFQGPLDEISGPETLEEAGVGEAILQRNFRWGPSIRYSYEKLRYFLRSPQAFLRICEERVTIPLSMSVVHGLALALFLASTLKKSNGWEPLWGMKRALLFFVLSYFSPVALAYLGYTLVRSSADFKKTLGFVRITKKQLLIALTVGFILLVITWVATFLFAVHDVDVPKSGVQKQLEESFIRTVFETLVAAPIVEEALFAGFLYPIMRKRLGVKLGIALDSFCFAFLHFKFVLIPLYFVGAVIKMYAYERTHCIYVPMIIHFVHNLLIIALILL